MLGKALLTAFEKAAGMLRRFELAFGGAGVLLFLVGFWSMDAGAKMVGGWLCLIGIWTAGVAIFSHVYVSMVTQSDGGLVTLFDVSVSRVV